MSTTSRNFINLLKLLTYNNWERLETMMKRFLYLYPELFIECDTYDPGDCKQGNCREFRNMAK